MSLSALMKLLVRRWRVVLAGLVLLIPALGYVRSQPAIYWAERHVLIVEPGVTHRQAVWEQQSERLVALAAAVEHEVNDGEPVTRLNSNNARLFALGERDTYQVRLYNRANQWIYSFPAPLLIVEAVGDSQERVNALLDEATTRIEKSVTALQSRGGVPPASQATVISRDSEPAARMGPDSAGTLRAEAGVILLVLVATVASAVEVDRRGRRRERADVREADDLSVSATEPKREPALV